MLRVECARETTHRRTIYIRGRGLIERDDKTRAGM